MRTEENCRQLLSHWGNIISFVELMDEDGFYRAPMVQIETTELEEINYKGEAKVGDKCYAYKIRETAQKYDVFSSLQTFPHFEIHETPPDSPLLNQQSEEGVNPFVSSPQMRATDLPLTEIEWEEHRPAKIVNRDDFNGSENSQIATDEESDIEDSQSILCNKTDGTLNSQLLDDSCNHSHNSTPCNPMHNFFEEDNSEGQLLNPTTPLNQVDENIQLQPIWDARDSLSSEQSMFYLDKGDHLSLLDDSKGEDLSHMSSQHSLMNEIKKLKIKSSRGRPRKIQARKENKSFKIPKNKKKFLRLGEESLPVITNNNFSAGAWEAREIFNTGVNMGLIPKFGEVRSISLIQEQLNL